MDSGQPGKSNTVWVFNGTPAAQISLVFVQFCLLVFFLSFFASPVISYLIGHRQIIREKKYSNILRNTVPCIMP